MRERWVLLDAPALQALEVDVRELSGTEALNELFAYETRVTLRDVVDGEERAEQLLEQPVTLRFMDAEREVRRVNGIVREASSVRDLEHRLTHLDLTVVHRAWLMSQRFGAGKQTNAGAAFQRTKTGRGGP